MAATIALIVSHVSKIPLQQMCAHPYLIRRMGVLSHVGVNSKGETQPTMVDVSGKFATRRTAVAQTILRLPTFVGVHLSKPITEAAVSKASVS